MITFTQYGGPEVLSMAELPLPTLTTSQVLVRVEFAGVNFIDVYKRTGIYPSPHLPAVLGQEISGVVESVGAEVRSIRVGDRIAAITDTGGYAEYVAIEESAAVPLPDEISSETACAVLLQGLTAHYLSYSTFPLCAGTSCLVHAAAGGVGLLLVQLAKQRGAAVAGVVSNQEKATLASEAGADYVIDYSHEDIVACVREWSGGRGVDVVYDSVGQATIMKSLAVLKPRGLLVSYGQSSGSVPPLDIQLLSSHGSVFLTRPRLAHYIQDREELMGRSEDLFEAIRRGALSVRIHETFALDDALSAHRALQSRQTSGKLLLSCQED